MAASPWREGLLALGVLGLVLVLTHAVGLPVANLLEAHVVAPLAGAAARALSEAPVWMQGLVVDGVVRGVGTVLTLVPMLGVLFAAAGLLEQTGWLSRVTLAAQRLTGRLGLSGAVAIPLCFGFACNVPAVVSLRSVPSPRERCAAMLLAPFVPCSARLAAVVLLAPMFFPRSAPLVVCGLVSLNVLLLRETITAAVSPASALSYLAIQILFVPCVPTLWAIARESGNWWWSIASAALMLFVSLAAGAVVFQAGRFL